MLGAACLKSGPGNHLISLSLLSPLCPCHLLTIVPLSFTVTMSLSLIVPDRELVSPSEVTDTLDQPQLDKGRREREELGVSSKELLRTLSGGISTKQQMLVTAADNTVLG